MARHKTWLLAVLLFIVLAVATARTKAVSPAEGWFADAGLTLATKGFLGTNILESTGTWLAGIDRHTYWIMPLHPVVQAAWYRAFGFSLRRMRALSIVWGLVALAAWFLLLRRLSGYHSAVLGVILIATDYCFVERAADGRMDMMCAALGFSAIAAYVCLRERCRGWAIVVSHSLMAASCLTHPAAAIPLCGLVLITWLLDGWRIGWRAAALTIAPYCVAAAGYGWYILQDPASFQSQFGGNVSGIAQELSGVTRFQGLSAPLAALRAEIKLRYLTAFGGYASWSDPVRLQLLVLLAYAGGLTAPLFDKAMRGKPAVRLLFVWAAAAGAILWLLEGSKVHEYLAHSIPIFGALAALWISDRTAGRAYLGYGIVAGLVCCNLLAIGDGIRQNPYEREYLTAVRFLNAHTTPATPITASGEFGFDFGFDRNVKDDVRLGYFSGRLPEFFVMAPWYGRWIAMAKVRDPAIYEYFQRTLAERYQQVYRNPRYTIYRRRAE